MTSLARWLSLLGGGSLRAQARLAAAEGSAALAERLELAAIEWEAVRRRWLWLLLLSVLLAVFLLVLLLAGSTAVVVHYWDTEHRVVAAWAVAGFWLFAWLAALWALWAVAVRSAPAFELTRAELVRDWSFIRESL